MLALAPFLVRAVGEMLKNFPAPLHRRNQTQASNSSAPAIHKFVTAFSDHKLIFSYFDPLL